MPYQLPGIHLEPSFFIDGFGASVDNGPTAHEYAHGEGQESVFETGVFYQGGKSYDA